MGPLERSTASGQHMELLEQWSFWTNPTTWQISAKLWKRENMGEHGITRLELIWIKKVGPSEKPSSFNCWSCQDGSTARAAGAMGGGECCMGSSVSAAGRVSCGLRAQCCMDLHGSVWSIWMLWEELYRETMWNPSRGYMFSGCLQEQNGQLGWLYLRSKSFDFLPLSRSTGRKAPELGGLLTISLRKLSLVRDSAGHGYSS